MVKRHQFRLTWRKTFTENGCSKNSYMFLKAWLKKQMLDHSYCCCIKYNPASFSATPFQCKDRESGDVFAITLLRSSSQLLSSCMNTFFIILIYNQFLQFIVFILISADTHYILIFYSDLLIKQMFFLITCRRKETPHSMLLLRQDRLYRQNYQPFMVLILARKIPMEKLQLTMQGRRL